MKRSRQHITDCVASLSSNHNLTNDWQEVLRQAATLLREDAAAMDEAGATIGALRAEVEALREKIAANAPKVQAWDVWDEALSRPGVEATEYNTVQCFEGRREYSIVWDYTDHRGDSHEIEGRGPTHWAAILNAAQDLEAHIARAEGEGEKP